MKNKLAKLEYLPNNFKILEEGDHVICAVSKKIIKLEKLMDNKFSMGCLVFMKEFFKQKAIIKKIINFGILLWNLN